jgi:hypothetical protein
MDAETIVATVLGEELDMVDSDIEQMKRDATGCYVHSMGERRWISSALIHILMVAVAERAIEETEAELVRLDFR